jgi:hypothetical protein
MTLATPLLLSLLLAAERAGNELLCAVTITPPQTASVITGRAQGLLNGMNLTAPSSLAIAGIKPSMWRGPIASWLWPNRTSCKGPRTCCTPDACPAPFAEAERLTSLGMRQQYILDAFHTGVGACEWNSFNKVPHQCSLPGGPSDPDFEQWKYTVVAAANEAKRRGLTDVGFDVWNEPNGDDKLNCMATDKCPFDANMTVIRFFALWDVAYKTVKSILPDARLIGPSLADGGPGIFGWTTSVFPWVQEFLQHTHAAGTMPDVLSWHVTMVAANATLLIDHHTELAEWCTAHSIPLPKIGHNEVMGPTETLDAAANVAYLFV